MKLTCPNSCRIFLAPGMYLYIAFLLLLLPISWLVAAAIAVMVHELFHFCAIKAFGLRIYSVRIGINGARIHTEPMTVKQELICALAGPFGGSLLLLVADRAPMVALCAGFQTLFNLLPAYPLDGGRVLRCGAKLLLPASWTDMVCRGAEYAVMSGVLLLGIYGTCVLKAGLIPTVFTVLFLFGSLKTKISLQTGHRQGTITVP